MLLDTILWAVGLIFSFCLGMMLITVAFFWPRPLQPPELCPHGQEWDECPGCRC